MRYITADYIYNHKLKTFVKGGVVVIDEENKIVEILEKASLNLALSSVMESYEGVLIPGFVNTHCHLELSHLYNKIEKGKGLFQFVKDIEHYRDTDSDTVQFAMQKAQQQMIDNGIVAVGDISNTNVSFEIKKLQQAYYHTFIEVFAFNPARAEMVFNKGLELEKEAHQNNLPATITLHAPYSASTELIKKVAEHSALNGGVLSIHNQETATEDEFFKTKTGNLLEHYKRFNIDVSNWQQPKTSSVQATLSALNLKNNKIQLVHNTYTTQEDIEWVNQKFSNVYWCFCPNANLYIEGKLPAIPLFVQNKCKITLGTDSLASNWQLSILKEMQTVHKEYPQIPITNLIEWATYNGAEYLGVQNIYGSIDVNKKPGLVLLDNFNLDKPESFINAGVTVIA